MKLVKTEQPVTSDRIMIDGTSSSKTYMVFARKGDVVLGLQPNMMGPAPRFGGPEGTTYVGARLRSTRDAEAMVKIVGTGNVVTLQPNPVEPASAWSNVVWEKQYKEYASTQVSAFIRGSEKDLTTLKSSFDKGAMGHKMVEYLAELVGLENFVVDPNELAAFVNETFDPVLVTLEAKAAAKIKYDEMVSEHVGSFGIQAEQMKKLHAALNPGSTDAEEQAGEDEADED